MRVRFLKLLVPVASVFVALTILEMACRFMVWYAPEPQGFPTAMQDHWRWRHEKLNSLGFRDIERAVESTRPRIAVVGDSYAFGWGIQNVEVRYGERLAGMLGWEPIIAARAGTHTLQHIEFVEKILPFQPRVIVLLYVFNDIDYLRPVRNPVEIPLQALFERSYLYQQVVLRFRGLLETPVPDPYKDDYVLALHAADLRRFTDVARRGGASVGVVPFPRMTGDDGHYSRLVHAAGQAGVPVWPIDHAFESYERRDLMLNGFDTHPNRMALQIAAKATIPYVDLDRRPAP